MTGQPLDPRPSTLDREAQTFGGESLLIRYVNFVKLPHTLFALPFALLGVLAASRVAPVTAGDVALVIIAFSAARWAAMGFNRIADRSFDARNPRTQNRELPRGTLSLTQAWVSVVLAAGIFVVAAAVLNPLCLLLSPVALALDHALQPLQAIHLVAAPLARREPGDRPGRRVPGGHRPLERPGLDAARHHGGGRHLGRRVRHLLRAARCGFRPGSRDFGAPWSGWASRARSCWPSCSTAVTIPALALFGYAAGFGLWYYIGLVVAAGILVYEHQLVRPGDLCRLDAAFFTMNGVMSVTGVWVCARRSGGMKAVRRIRRYGGRSKRQEAQDRLSRRPCPSWQTPKRASGKDEAYTAVPPYRRTAPSTPSAPPPRTAAADDLPPRRPRAYRRLGRALRRSLARGAGPRSGAGLADRRPSMACGCCGKSATSSRWRG